MIKRVLPILFLFAGFQANGALITQSWTLEVDRTVHVGIDVDELFTVTSTFDDESTSMHRYDDGSNGTDDGGVGEELDHTWCLYCSESTDVTVLDSSVYGFLADADINLSAMVAALDHDDMIDTNSTNLSRELQYNGNYYLLVSSDIFRFSLSSRTDTAWFETGHVEGDGVRWRRTWFDVVDMTSSAASVPEPSIIALFGAGLVGLGIARRRKSRQA